MQNSEVNLCRGDIFVKYNDELNYEVFLCHDRNILISTSILGMELHLVENVLKTTNEYKIIKVKENLNWQKKKKLNAHLSSMVTKDTALSFKERLSFLKYILFVYKNILDVRVLENSMPTTLNNIINSEKVIVVRGIIE